MRVETDPGAVAALRNSAEVRGTSMRLATVGAAGAARRSRVDTGAMRAGWTATPIDNGGARVSNPVPHTVYNEFGTSRMSAQPMARPSQDDVRAAL